MLIAHTSFHTVSLLHTYKKATEIMTWSYDFQLYMFVPTCVIAFILYWKHIGSWAWLNNLKFRTGSPREISYNISYHQHVLNWGMQSAGSIPRVDNDDIGNCHQRNAAQIYTNKDAKELYV